MHQHAYLVGRKHSRLVLYTTLHMITTVSVHAAHVICLLMIQVRATMSHRGASLRYWVITLLISGQGHSEVHWGKSEKLRHDSPLSLTSRRRDAPLCKLVAIRCFPHRS